MKPWESEEEKSQPSDRVWRLPSGRYARLKKCMKYNTWCGYVGVDFTSPLYKKSHKILKGTSRIHGGVSFSGFLSPLKRRGRETSNIWWFGLDCNHGVLPLLHSFASFSDTIAEENLLSMLEFFKNEIMDVIPNEEEIFKRLDIMCACLGINRSYKDCTFVRSQIEELDAVIGRNEVMMRRNKTLSVIVKEILFGNSGLFDEQDEYEDVRIVKISF